MSRIVNKWSDDLSAGREVRAEIAGYLKAGLRKQRGEKFISADVKTELKEVKERLRRTDARYRAKDTYVNALLELQALSEEEIILRAEQNRKLFIKKPAYFAALYEVAERLGLFEN